MSHGICRQMPCIEPVPERTLHGRRAMLGEGYDTATWWTFRSGE
jgi:hypothetical protein